jgi:uncharacterized protein (AIM24 family)
MPSGKLTKVSKVGNKDKLDERTLSVRVDNHLDLKRMETFSKGDGKYIPKFKITNGPASATAVMYLKKDQTVYDQIGFLNYCDSSLKINTSYDSFWSSLWRSLTTTQSFFMTYYTGTQTKESVSAFAPVLHGDMFAVRIKPGEKYMISSNSFVCATENIKLTTQTKFKNLFVGENLFFSVAEVVKKDNKELSDGMVWILSYGGFERLHIDKGEKIKIDAGLFCLANYDNDYKITTLSGLKSFFLSGHTTMMEFEGPCEVYTHCRNLTKYLNYIKSQIVTPYISNIEHKINKIEKK